MAEPQKSDFVVFYAWQDDLPSVTNLNAIRSALRVVSSKMEHDHSGAGLRVILDEATRGVPGSPYIPGKIMEKIEACDAFVCDMTTVNAADSKKTPNPNVLFELGYAVSQVGWDRVIMLFNTAFGNFPNDLPFDVDRHRASPYTLVKPAGEKDKVSTDKLASLLDDALNLIYRKNPAKPSISKAFTPEQKIRQRDIASLKWVLSTIHLPSLDEFISIVPYKINDPIFHFWEGFHAVYSNSLFYLYDAEVKGHISNLHDAWLTCLSYDQHYHPNASHRYYIFRNPGDLPLSADQKKAWDHIEKAASALRDARDKLLSSIRTKYIEIDINDMSKDAWKEYVEFNKAMLEGFEKGTQERKKQ